MNETAVVACASIQDFEKLSTPEYYLAVALEPNDDAIRGWLALAESGATVESLRKWIQTVLGFSPMPWTTTDRDDVCWTANHANKGPAFWFGEHDSDNGRTPDLHGPNLITAVRDLFGVGTGPNGAGISCDLFHGKAKPAAKRKTKPAIAKPAGDELEYVDAAVDDIRVAYNDREHFDDDALADLAADIKRRGIDQPLLVRPNSNDTPERFELIAGERRLRAAALAKLATVPVRIRRIADEDVAVARLQENLQREDLNAIEKARGIQKLIADNGLTQKQAGALLGMKQGTVANTLRLLKLPTGIQNLVVAGKLAETLARDCVTTFAPWADRPAVVTAIENEVERDPIQHPDDAAEIVREAFCSLCDDDTVRLANAAAWSPVATAFKLTAARKKKLDCVEVPERFGGGVKVYAFNVSLYDELQSEAIEKGRDAIRVDQKARESAKPGAAAEDPKVKAKERRDALAKKIAGYRVGWIQQQVVKWFDAAEAIEESFLLRLLLHFAGGVSSNSCDRHRNGTLQKLAKSVGANPKRNNWGDMRVYPTLATVAADKLQDVALGFLRESMRLPADGYGNHIDVVELEAIAADLGVDIATQWRLDETFLKLHTKDQLATLCKEWKLKPTAGMAVNGKRTDFIAWILEADQSKQLPAPKSLTK